MKTFIFSCLTFLFFTVQCNAGDVGKTNSPAYWGRHYHQFHYVPPVYTPRSYAPPARILPYSIKPVYPVLPVRPNLPSYAPRDYYGYPYGRYYYANPNIVFGRKF